MDSRLRKAAEEGDINALYECIEQDPNVLRSFDNYEFVNTPLHIAAAGGHADFAMAILNLKPSFGRKLNQNVYSPIHLALQNGHEATVLRLFEADKDSIRVKGKEGYTVLHQAAERGNVQLLVEFLKHCPTSIEDVTIRNETALHIAAKNDRFEALELLARWLQRSHIYCKVSRKHLINSKDTEGNAVLHIAAFPIQHQMIKILVECGADRMATNMNRETALDIVKNQRINTQDRATSLEILRHGCFSRFMIDFKRRNIIPLNELLRSKISFLERLIMGIRLPLLNLSAERINALLVVLVLMLTATFQAVHSPPGGVWQGEADHAAAHDVDYSLVGSSVMTSNNYFFFVALNSLVFAATSGFTITLLEFVGVASNIMFFVEILLSSFTCCFLFAVLVIYPSNDVGKTSRLLPFYFLAIIAAMEIGRRLNSMLPSRFHNLMSCFREM